MIIKCTCCGAGFDGEASYGFKCKYCGTYNHLDIITNKSYAERLEIASNHIKNYEFSEADHIYCDLYRNAKKGDDGLKAILLWGRLLCYYGIVYVHSYTTGLMVPTFMNFTFDKEDILDNEYYKELLSLSIDENEKANYKTNATLLDKYYHQIGVDLKSTPNYDYFICSKISAATEKDPNNSAIAPDKEQALKLYQDLTKQGLKVFFSAVSLEKVESDSSIYTALAKSNHLIIVSTRKDYLESVWVMSEWSRWLHFIKIHEKKDNSLYLYIPNYKTNRFALPPSLNKQVYSVDDYSDLINTLTTKNTRLSGIKRKEFKDVEVKPKAPGEDQLIDAANKYLKSRRFDKVKEQVNEILSQNATSLEALKLLFFAENEVNNFDEWASNNHITQNIKLYETILEYANAEERASIIASTYKKLKNAIQDFDLLELYISIETHANELADLLNIALKDLKEEEVNLLTNALLDVNPVDHRAYFARYLISKKINNYLDLVNDFDTKDQNFIHARNGFVQEFPTAKTNLYMDLDNDLYDYHDKPLDKLSKEDFLIDLNQIHFDKEKVDDLFTKQNKENEKKKKELEERNRLEEEHQKELARQKAIEEEKERKEKEKQEKANERKEKRKYKAEDRKEKRKYKARKRKEKREEMKDNFIDFIKDHSSPILLIIALLLVLAGSFLSWLDILWYIPPILIVIGYIIFYFTEYTNIGFSLVSDTIYIETRFGDLYVTHIMALALIFFNNIICCWIHNNYFPFLIITIAFMLIIIISVAIRYGKERNVKSGDLIFIVLSSYFFSLIMACFVAGVIINIYYIFNFMYIWWQLLFDVILFAALPNLFIAIIFLFKKKIYEVNFRLMLYMMAILVTVVNIGMLVLDIVGAVNGTLYGIGFWGVQLPLELFEGALTYEYFYLADRGN